MQMIRFTDDQYAKISDQAAAAGYADIADFLASLANTDRSAAAADLPTLPARIETADLIREQGVKPIADFRALQADFYPAGETSEEFLQPIEERRRDDAPVAG